MIRITLPRQRLILHYAPHLEDVRLLTSYSGGDGEGEDEVMSDGHLRTLDPELAAYPFEGLGGWKDLTGYVTQEALDDVIGVQGRVDGMKVVQGEEEDKEELLPEHRALEKRGVDTGAGDGDQRAMKFVAFRLKKSWRDGAVGEELSRYAVDKSWLFGHIVNTQLRGGKCLVHHFYSSTSSLWMAVCRPSDSSGSTPTLLHIPVEPLFVLLFARIQTSLASFYTLFSPSGLSDHLPSPFHHLPHLIQLYNKFHSNSVHLLHPSLIRAITSITSRRLRLRTPRNGLVFRGRD